MPAASLYSPESFILDYRADQRLLIGRWLRPASLTELQAHYEAVLASAQAHGCRHWLLDFRRRPSGDAAAVHWFGSVFTPQVVAAFDKPVYCAYFAMLSHDQATTHAGVDANIRQGIPLGMHYHFFNHEGNCLAWLARQP